MAPIPNVLTIAGSDSGGGAGIQADLKTFSALGTFGASVIAALTAQNTRAVTAIHNVPPDFVEAQLNAVFSDIEMAAVKVGMLGSAPLIERVARGLVRHEVRTLVVDPVMVAKSGDPLLEPDAVQHLTEQLIPLATVLTPNLPEARVLLNQPFESTEAAQRQAAKALLALGPKYVLVKGGHFETEESVDWLVGPNGEMRLAAPRYATPNTHGTGCTLSSAIAAFLAHGYDVPAAVERAKAYMTAAIQHADQLAVGRGHGPVHHFHALYAGHGLGPS